MKLSAVFTAAALAAAMAAPAHAAYTINIDQVGSDVVESGSGSINFTALTFDTFYGGGSTMNASAGQLFLIDSNGYGDLYNGGVSGPANFGAGGAFSPTSASAGSLGSIGVNGANEIFIPAGYFPGDPIDASAATWSGTTLGALGLTTGTYVWWWGNPDAGSYDTLTINIGNSVPEPASWAMMTLGLGGLGAALRSRRRLANARA